MSFLAVDKVTHTYGAARPILNQVSLQVQPGEFVSLVGRSGCGKTTLLKTVAGLLVPEQGLIMLDGKAVTEPGQEMGLVFQTPTLLEWKTVQDNVLLPIALRRKPTADDQLRAEGFLQMVGLADHAGKYPTELSGGQQSRVAIARALLQEPSLLLLDEPFAALDALTREELQTELLRICSERQMTVLFITHDIPEAVYLSDRVVVMEEGRLMREVGIPLPKPRQPEVRYSTAFNQLGLEIRRAMEAGETT